ncbi:hypothetical protein ANN_23046 [Periplaneta americana]|uniref:Uncharacterized protein n=1 Tax=Periplaneta americana TaxID=6978 RepID=A0ABQ8SK01_PERAM|nr:hypothetical protein ANN_23046 [Periplaneta americana]
MASLYEDGNAPAGSLKAICKPSPKTGKRTALISLALCIFIQPLMPSTFVKEFQTYIGLFKNGSYVTSDPRNIRCKMAARTNTEVCSVIRFLRLKGTSLTENHLQIIEVYGANVILRKARFRVIYAAAPCAVTAAGHCEKRFRVDDRMVQLIFEPFRAEGVESPSINHKEQPLFRCYSTPSSEPTRSQRYLNFAACCAILTDLCSLHLIPSIDYIHWKRIQFDGCQAKDAAAAGDRNPRSSNFKNILNIIPDDATLHQEEITPSIYDETIQKIRDEIKDSSIWVSNETPDKEVYKCELKTNVDKCEFKTNGPAEDSNYKIPVNNVEEVLVKFLATFDDNGTKTGSFERIRQSTLQY